VVTVAATRAYLTERYASGVDRLLWNTEKRLHAGPERDQVGGPGSNIGPCRGHGYRGQPRAPRRPPGWTSTILNMVFHAAHETEMNAETLAAVLDLHDARAAHARQRSLKVAVRAAQLAAGGLAPLARAS
jgi:hypothetical protein